MRAAHVAGWVASLLMFASVPRAGAQTFAPNVASRRVLALMECDECMERELSTVTRLGAQALPALRAALLGPDTVRQRILERSLRAYVHPALTDEMIRHQLENVRTMYTRRATQAIVIISPVEARIALCAARGGGSLTPRGRDAVDAALARLGGTCH